ncbi:hypothetical protein HU200_022768 [Digitaria exilis]|uniref:Uncharacterized protein n=1 Tax=Digitaria exilis TaxID=1010633 RepID=A0A835EXA1_9POAL|nr:hypothetical protein HU200_022768 [Digitaria exilis]
MDDASVQAPEHRPVSASPVADATGVPIIDLSPLIAATPPSYRGWTRRAMSGPSSWRWATIIVPLPAARRSPPLLRPDFANQTGSSGFFSLPQHDHLLASKEKRPLTKWSAAFIQRKDPCCSVDEDGVRAPREADHLTEHCLDVDSLVLCPCLLLLRPEVEEPTVGRCGGKAQPAAVCLHQDHAREVSRRLHHGQPVATQVPVGHKCIDRRRNQPIVTAPDRPAQDKRGRQTSHLKAVATSPPSQDNAGGDQRTMGSLTSYTNAGNDYTESRTGHYNGRIVPESPASRFPPPATAMSATKGNPSTEMRTTWTHAPPARGTPRAQGVRRWDERAVMAHGKARRRAGRRRHGSVRIEKPPAAGAEEEGERKECARVRVRVLRSTAEISAGVDDARCALGRFGGPATLSSPPAHLSRAEPCMRAELRPEPLSRDLSRAARTAEPSLNRAEPRPPCCFAFGPALIGGAINPWLRPQIAHRKIKGDAGQDFELSQPSPPHRRPRTMPVETRRTTGSPTSYTNAGNDYTESRTSYYNGRIVLVHCCWLMF